MNFKYITNPKAQIVHKGQKVLSVKEIVDSISFANKALKELNDTTMRFDINIFETLGMRNLSGMIGEYFARSVVKTASDRFASNLHQDGYPDLLLIDGERKRKYFESLYTVENGKKYPIDKEHFSPFKYGGLEVKATCGSTPSATIVPKPLIGEQRIDLLCGFDWKAHHRTTNHLLGILWDFIDGNPVIVGCFYQNKLTTDDWGKIVKPKDDGGRTTSVSIMNATGVKKMCKNWIAIIDDEKYTSALARSKWIGYDVKQP